MIDLAEDAPSNPLLRLGAQPIALTAAALLLLIAGVTSIAIWRAYTGSAPETDRVVASRQARTAQASEQLVEKTKGLEATQQESIDQLQVVQDQLQSMKRLLAFQQADTKRLSEQVTTLNESIDGLRQSFASARATETEAPSVTRRKPARHPVHASARKRSRG
ncbi:chromosome segregation ATPase [Bradyrhizobium sp. F1.13.1]